ncbi:MAG: peptide chain release factor N(5)-glutamine methyltransferase [Gammaproteobacteria bacterium]|uniref:Release factor glutamine methyltransferase n=1 Tax=Candidatus Thiopontia autotrophica TaxID=2841688 RepID=A0A8J6PBN8_9GAMM|nr:peptide chain release factor N(5)-glutamine methyltransferase [Candidatus Thiopontia autotrophica]MBL6968623.1 peptide chain release factor N(5)-glutamine methyltransferase [Gammaproteobacteria bacterium]
MTTIEQSLQHATEQLTKSGSDTAHLDSELLLGNVIGRSRTWLHTWPESTIDNDNLHLFSNLIQRRADGEPVAHLIGKQEFWSLSLKITADTLVPRPETEVMVEQVLGLVPEEAEWKIADLGTGSGAIAIAVANERAGCTITATDQSAATLAVARENGHSHHLKNIKFLQGSWFEPLDSIDQRYDLILSNPPYIASSDPHLEQGDLRYEPDSALISGDSGMDDLNHLVNNARGYLLPDGILMVEHGYDQGKKVRSLFQHNNFSGVTTLHDLAGLERITYGIRV